MNTPSTPTPSVSCRYLCNRLYLLKLFRPHEAEKYLAQEVVSSRKSSGLATPYPAPFSTTSSPVFRRFWMPLCFRECAFLPRSFLVLTSCSTLMSAAGRLNHLQPYPGFSQLAMLCQNALVIYPPGT